jgi:hypothetical protein
LRSFSDKPFCLACYTPCLLMVAATSPISGIMAMTFSLGLILAPLICAAYLFSGLRLPIAAPATWATPAKKGASVKDPISS